MDNKNMPDFSKMLAEVEAEEAKLAEEAAKENIDYDVNVPKQIQLNENQTRTLCQRLSGLDNLGNKKATVGYLAYIDNSAGTVMPNELPIKLSEAVASAVPNAQLPDFFTVDVLFPSEDSMELKKFWAVLEKHRMDELNAGVGQVPIFVLGLEENYTKDDDKEDILTAQFINPLTFYISRTSPSQKVEEFASSEGEKVGGNMVRILFHSNTINFSLMSKENAILLSNPEDIIETKEEETKEEPESIEDILGISIPAGYYDMDDDK